MSDDFFEDVHVRWLKINDAVVGEFYYETIPRCVNSAGLKYLGRLGLPLGSARTRVMFRLREPAAFGPYGENVYDNNRLLVQENWEEIAALCEKLDVELRASNKVKLEVL
jgi:hypothetical protein